MKAVLLLDICCQIYQTPGCVICVLLNQFYSFCISLSVAHPQGQLQEEQQKSVELSVSLGEAGTHTQNPQRVEELRCQTTADPNGSMALPHWPGATSTGTSGRRSRWRWRRGTGRKKVHKEWTCRKLVKLILIYLYALILMLLLLFLSFPSGKCSENTKDSAPLGGCCKAFHASFWRHCERPRPVEAGSFCGKNGRNSEMEVLFQVVSNGST